MSELINPYSPYKIFCHYDNWMNVYSWYIGISKGIVTKLPPPITISIDPANKCNMKCIGCNADFVLSQKTQALLDRKYLEKLSEALKSWEIKGACLGGGGEATLNTDFSSFVYDLRRNGIKVGIVSNGLQNNIVDNLLSWVGVSVDAGTKHVWANVHGCKPSLFTTVLDNMKAAIDKGVDVTYKYLIRPENIFDIYPAIEKAVSIGCKSFHIRPMAIPWFDTIRPIFDQTDVYDAKYQFEEAKKIFSDKIEIIGVFDKLGQNWEVKHDFKKCWAIFATCVFQANKKIGLCCDLRGCPTVEVGPFDDPATFINEFWGSKEHWEIQHKIDINKCSRCTFSLLNTFFEEAIIQDRLMPDFI